MASLSATNENVVSGGGATAYEPFSTGIPRDTLKEWEAAVTAARESQANAPGVRVAEAGDIYATTTARGCGSASWWGTRVNSGGQTIMGSGGDYTHLFIEIGKDEKTGNGMCMNRIRGPVPE